ncbi:hypothetical protein E8E12_001806 [Didymella heteroderae]|uniref:Uncharacterized protein n=1 Tax=Didymella heteroderae TaxID=1769908 RepID=A0A9P4WKP6_9PLEO|nr:hypothetical protein E8E12_001806 [Didymella heteroderae]
MSPSSSPEVDMRHPNRIGIPDLRPLPLTTTRLNHRPGPWLQVMVRISEILSEQTFAYNHVEVVKRHRDDENPDEALPCLLVTTDTSIPGQRDVWSRCAIEVYRLLRELDVNWGVEFIDAVTLSGEDIEPILDTDRSQIAAWERLSGAILEQICDTQYLSLEAGWVVSGNQDPQRRATIFISASDAEERVWDDILPHIKAEANPDFEVEVRYLATLSSTTSPVPEASSETRVGSSLQSAEIFDPRIMIGASIGCADDDRTATAGLRVRLSHAEVGDLGYFALTNHHVVAKGPLKDWPLQTPLLPTDPICMQGRAVMVSPSDGDTEALLDVWKGEVVTNQTKVAKEPWNPRWEQRLKAAQDEVVYLETKPSRTLGTVYASSGFRTIDNEVLGDSFSKQMSELKEPVLKEHQALSKAIAGRRLHWGLNWALIKLDPSRQMSAILPEGTDKVAIPHAAMVRHWRSIDPCAIYQVAKHGRMSKWTTGRMNAISSFLRLRQDFSSVVPMKMGKDSEDKSRFSDPILVYGILSNTPNREFIAPGDLGSVILNNQPDKDASVVGLGFCANNATNVSYMTPFDLLVKDIENVTGAIIIEPSNGGIATGMD